MGPRTRPRRRPWTDYTSDHRRTTIRTTATAVRNFGFRLDRLRGAWSGVRSHGVRTAEAARSLISTKSEGWAGLGASPVGPAARSRERLPSSLEQPGRVPPSTFPRRSVGAHETPPSPCPVSRAASRRHCSAVRLATKAARGSAFAFSALLVQMAGRVAVTSDRFSLTIGVPLPTELIARGGWLGCTCYR
jgi:hypothetical protein